MTGGSDATIHPPSSTSALADIAKQARHRVLELELQRAALAIAGDEPNRDERQQERGGELARAERRRPHADERRERFADARGGAVEAAQLRIGPHGADERDADERADQQRASPTRRATPAARAIPSRAATRTPSYVSARNTSSKVDDRA